MAKNKDVIVDANADVVPAGVTLVDDTGKTVEPEAPVVEKKVEPPKEKVVLKAEEPVKQVVVEEKSFTDLKQDAQIKYLQAGMKFLVGKLSGEEQQDFYRSFPELR